MARKGKEKAVEESSATSHADATSSDCLPPTPMTLAPVEAHSGSLGAESVDSASDLQDAASKDSNSSALSQSPITSLPVPELIRTLEFEVAYDNLMEVIELTDAHSIDPTAADKVSLVFKLAVVRCCPSGRPYLQSCVLRHSGAFCEIQISSPGQSEQDSGYRHQHRREESLSGDQEAEKLHQLSRQRAVPPVSDAIPDAEDRGEG